MLPTAQQIHKLQSATPSAATSCFVCRQKDSCKSISELHPMVQPEATKFLRVINTVLNRLDSTCAQISDEYLQELKHSPEHYDRLATYHVDLLARYIAKEVDILYKGLRVSSIEHIEMRYQREVPQNNPKNDQEVNAVD